MGNAVEASSTKLTKADRLYEVKRSAVEISRFAGDDSNESGEKGDNILSNILSQEERLNEMKRQLLYQQDYDLELIYDKKG